MLPNIEPQTSGIKSRPLDRLSSVTSGVEVRVLMRVFPEMETEAVSLTVVSRVLCDEGLENGEIVVNQSDTLLRTLLGRSDNSGRNNRDCDDVPDVGERLLEGCPEGSTGERAGLMKL